MSRISSGHLKILQRRIAYLTEHIDEDSESADNHTYDKAEVAALKAVIQYVDDEERNLIYKRVYKKAYRDGQQSLFKFYKKVLKKATHSGNVGALQFLLDKTNEWQNETDVNLEVDLLA